VNLESWANGEARPRRSVRFNANVRDCKLTGWKIEGQDESPDQLIGAGGARAALLRNFEFCLPLNWLLATPGSSSENNGNGGRSQSGAAIAATRKLRLRFSLWQNRLPVDALPVEGWIELQLLSEAELASL
jgi:hypothetical protein